MAHRLYHNLSRDFVGKNVQVADNSDVAVYNVVQLLEGIDHTVAEAAVQLADAFVDEKEVGGDALQGEVGEAEREGDRDKEALATGDHLHRARSITQVLVFHQDHQLATGTRKLITVGEHPKKIVGVVQEFLQDEALRDAAENLAVAVPEGVVEPLPLPHLLLQSVQLRQRVGVFLFVVGILLQNLPDLPDLLQFFRFQRILFENQPLNIGQLFVFRHLRLQRFVLLQRFPRLLQLPEGGLCLFLHNFQKLT